MRTAQSKHPENADRAHAVTRRFNEAAVCATALRTKKLHRTSSPKPCHVVYNNDERVKGKRGRLRLGF